MCVCFALPFWPARPILSAHAQLVVPLARQQSTFTFDSDRNCARIPARVRSSALARRFGLRNWRWPTKLQNRRAFHYLFKMCVCCNGKFSLCCCRRRRRRRCVHLGAPARWLARPNQCPTRIKSGPTPSGRKLVGPDAYHAAWISSGALVLVALAQCVYTRRQPVDGPRASLLINLIQVARAQRLKRADRWAHILLLLTTSGRPDRRIARPAGRQARHTR